MIYVIYSLLVLTEKLAFFNKQGFIISLILLGFIKLSLVSVEIKRQIKHFSQPTVKDSILYYFVPSLSFGIGKFYEIFSDFQILQGVFLILLGFFKNTLVSTERNGGNKTMQLACTQIFCMMWGPFFFLEKENSMKQILRLSELA